MRPVGTARHGRFVGLCGALILSVGVVGCSEMKSARSLAGPETLGGEGHRAAALLYYQEAEAAETEALRYERRAQSISEHGDTKGFLRNGLITAAQELRAKAQKLEQLAAYHELEAETQTRERNTP